MEVSLFLGETEHGDDVAPDAVLADRAELLEAVEETVDVGQPMNVDKWIEDFAWARYGARNDNAIRAWQILAHTLYECPDLRHGPQGSFLAMPPSLSKNGGGFVRGSIFYDSAKVREAFRLLLDASGELGNRDTFRHDLVDVGRQVMSDIAQQQLHAELRSAYEAKDVARFRRAADAYCEAILDCDKLLSTHTMFQFGRYLKYPLSASHTTEGRAQWERNARRIITLWGGRRSTLFDYAQRQYGGLMRDYNMPAWRLYLNDVAGSLRGGGSSRADQEVRDFTEQWIQSRNSYPVEAEGDPVAAARMIWEKYASRAADVSGPETPLQINDHE